MVAARQDSNPRKHGSTFEEWVRATPNLQAELLLSSTAAFTASFAGLEHRDVTEWKARWADPQRAERTATVGASALRRRRHAGALRRGNLVLGRAIGWAPVVARAAVESPSCLHRKWMKAAEVVLRGRAIGRAGEAADARARLPKPQGVRALVRSVAPSTTRCTSTRRAAAPKSTRGRRRVRGAARVEGEPTAAVTLRVGALAQHPRSRTRRAWLHPRRPS